MSTLFEFHEIVEQLDSKHFNAGEERSWRGLDLKEAAAYFKVSEGEVLRAMHEVASREKLRYGETRCDSCGMPITFRERIPYDRSRKNHFIACPNRKAHRRRK